MSVVGFQQPVALPVGASSTHSFPRVVTPTPISTHCQVPPEDSGVVMEMEAGGFVMFQRRIGLEGVGPHSFKDGARFSAQCQRGWCHLLSGGPLAGGGVRGLGEFCHHKVKMSSASPCPLFLVVRVSA